MANINLGKTNKETKEVKEVIEQQVLKVRFKKLHEDAVLPTYAKSGDMCMDLTAIDCQYNAEMDCFVYKTGLAMETPEGYATLLFPRSSNRKTDAYLTNGVGVIDSGYRGELMACFKNRDRSITKQPYQVGERICQITIIPYPIIKTEWADELSETERGEGGYGSTGR